jgi:hypothetical protein
MERLDKYFKALTRAAFERHGFAQAEIVNQWQAIAGDKLARSAVPLRIIWPRRAPGEHKSGGILVVRVDPAMALDLQYQTPRVIERINGYFGYAAIAAVRIIRGEPVGAGARPGPAAGRQDPHPAQPPQVEVSGILDDRLSNALLKLGAGLQQRRSSYRE